MKKCNKCQVVKSYGEFSFDHKKGRDGRQPRCKACARDWYLANRERHIRNVALRNAKHRAVLAQKISDFFLVHPCVDCGETDLRVLEFDHRDGKAKTEAVGRMFTNSLSWKAIEAEIAKCDVRCCNCHRIRTGEQFGSWRIAAEAARAVVLAEQAQQEHADVLARLGRILPRQAGRTTPVSRLT